MPATLMAHAFWQMPDTSLDPVQLVNFFKNYVHGWWIGFYRSCKRSTCSASTLNAMNACALGSLELADGAAYYSRLSSQCSRSPSLKVGRVVEPG